MRRIATLLSLIAALSLWMTSTAHAGAPRDADATELTTDPSDDREDAERIDPLADAVSPLDQVVGDDADVLEVDADGIAHRRVRRVRRVRTRPVYRTGGSRTVVVTRARADGPQGKVLALPPRDSVLSAGLRFTAVSLGDTELGNETFHGATLGGIGGYVRGKFLSHFGMEFSVDVMGNFDGDYDQLTIPVLAGFMGHIFPTSKLDVYGIIGGGVLINSIDYQAVGVKVGTERTFSESFLQLAGHAGGGLELDLGALELTTDIRYLLLQARPERSAEIQLAVPMSDAGGSTDDVTHALQFMLGIGGNF